MTIMAQPTQDMDISSSFNPSDNLSNNESLTNFCSKEVAMDKRNETNLAQMHNGSINLTENYTNQEFLYSQSFDVKSFEDTFPWLIKFNKVMCSSVGCRSYQMLERLLLVYTQNILTSINTYCVKAFSMTKLKKHLNNTLIFFHLYWHDIKEYAGDCDSYLNRMSMLLEIYIDMELKTFRHIKDSSKIATKLISALWIYLNNSEKHIFRVLLKLKLITKKYTQICDPIFRKSFTSLRRNVESLTDIDYVRYLLVLKMWKRMKESFEEKKEVNKMALMILGPSTPKMRDELLKIIPKPPVEQENETLWLLQPNVFDLKTARNHFIALEDVMSFQYKDSCMLKTSNLNNSQKSQIISSRGSNYVQEYAMDYELNTIETSSLQNYHSFKNTRNYSKPVKQIFSVKGKNKFKKYKTASKLKPEEVVLIDLTEEDETVRADKCKKRKRKCKRKLEWLKIMKKKYKVQKQYNGIKCKNQVQIADAHSTESSENSMDKVLLEQLPISDNKVSESTESCALPEQEPLQENIYYINSQNTQDYIYKKKNKELKCMFHHKQCDICTSSLKQNDVQQNKVLRLVKLLTAVGQNIKEPKAILNLLKDNREQSVMSSEHTFFCRSIANESSEINTQGKEESFSQPKSSTETILLSKECQNSITNTQSIKQELPTSTDCNIIEPDTYFQNKSVYVQSDCHLQDFKPLENHSSQVVEAVKQKISCDTHECTNCYKQSEVKPFSYHNNSVFNMLKKEDTMQSTIEDNTTDKKLICDKNIICMLSDLDKCMDVLNRIGEHIITVHAEKQRLECLDKTDACAVSTTVFGDQTAESSLDWSQNINSLTKEKLRKLLELHGKKEFLTVCNCKDTQKWDNQETNADKNQLKFESDSSKKIISPPESKELDSYEKGHSIFSENKTSQKFVCNYVKSEFEQSVKDEHGESFGIMTHQSQKTIEHKMTMITNNNTNATESFIQDLKNTQDLNEDVHCESALQRFYQKTDIIKTQSVNEFENIDILDSILNGDITMEDEQEIFEDSQSSLMSPINYDNSNNVLNCITEFFSQSEHMYNNEREEKYVTSDTEKIVTPLPEGSLGTTGILNSLLDFDLTNMDSVPNDFMYSNVQAVNPRLIKKNFKGEILSVNDTVELKYQEKTFTVEKKDEENILLQKGKELCNSQNNSIDSNVDVVGFGLNSSRETLECPSLIKNVSSFTGQSTPLVDSGNTSSELKESFPKSNLSSPIHKLNTDTIMERSYIFQKEDTINQVQSFNDTANHVPPQICTSNDIPSNAIINCTSSPRDDHPSSHKHTVEVRTSPLTMKQSLDSYDSMSSADFMSCNTVTATQYELSDCDNFLNQRNIQKNIQHSYRGNQNQTMKHRVEINVQSGTSKRKLRHKKKIKMDGEEELSSFIVQPNEDELNMRCPQLTFVNTLNHQNAQGTCALPLSSLHTPYHQKSPHTVCVSKRMYKKLKCVDIQQLRNMSQQKQQTSSKCHEDSTIDTVLKEDSRHSTEDNILEDSSMLYKPMKKPHISQNTPYFKTSKKNLKSDTNVTKLTDKSDTKSSIQNVDLQSFKSVKKQTNVTLDEETLLKKKKVTPKLSSLPEANRMVSSVDQQEVQKKHFASMKRVLDNNKMECNIQDTAPNLQISIAINTTSISGTNWFRAKVLYVQIEEKIW